MSIYRLKLLEKYLNNKKPLVSFLCPPGLPVMLIFINANSPHFFNTHRISTPYEQYSTIP